MNKKEDGSRHYPHFMQLHERMRAARPEGRLLIAARTVETAAERARKMRATVDRQIAALATDAERWRAAATLSHVDAALASYPEIRSALLRIGEGYDRMATSAVDSHHRHFKKRAAG
jgi:uncharacterized sporulation protein YeaH/YhbH (DUF444 family)